MKKFNLYFAFLCACALIIASCNTDDNNSEVEPTTPETPKSDELPALPALTDICRAMDDVIFKSYCCNNFDTNQDKAISPEEAAAVTEINIESTTVVKSIKGIEYFPNLETINCSYCTGLTSVDLRYNSKLKEMLFPSCSSLSKILMPNELTSISAQAFSRCKSLYSLDIPENVETLGEEAFANCDNIIKIVMPGKITEIPRRCFRYSGKLRTLKLPKTVTTIRTDAFTDCTALNRWQIDSNLTTIEGGAFNRCKFECIYINCTTPPSITGALGNSADDIIYVPMAAVDAYKSAWTQYAEKIVGYNF